MSDSNRNCSEYFSLKIEMMEKIFTTKSGVTLYAEIKGEDVKSFSTDGKAEEIISALKEDYNSLDFVAKNMASMLLVLISKLGIKEQ